MDKLIYTLPAILKASGASADILEATCVAVWKHAVGEALSSHAVPVRLEGSTLVLAVADNIWKKQLESMRAQLLFRLNQALGQKLVQSLELRIDSKRIEQQRQSVSTAGEKTQFDSSVPIELLTSATQIEDQDLRRAFLGAASSCVRRLENPKSEF